jgi:hypothetical protein
MTLAVRRTLFMIVGALFALAVVIAAAARSGGDQAHASGPTTVVHVKQATLNQGCGDQSIVGAHFVINQISGSDAPGSISVTLSDGTTVTVDRSKQNRSTDQYTTIFTAGLRVTDATAVVPTAWTGQFVLSNYVCGTGGSSSPPASSAPASSAPGTGASGS